MWLFCGGFVVKASFFPSLWTEADHEGSDGKGVREKQL